MQVILQEDFPSLGFVGDLVNVKQGYARNFLFPKKIALPANPSNITLLEHRKKVLDVKKAEKKKLALQYKDKIEGVEIRIKHSVSEGGKLFGSVTVSELMEELVKNDLKVDRKLMKLEGPIKTLGEHDVEIKLHQEVTAKLKVIVEAKEEPKAEKKEEKKTKEASPRKKSAKAAEKAEAAPAAETEDKAE